MKIVQIKYVDWRRSLGQNLPVDALSAKEALAARASAQANARASAQANARASSQR